jgi:hypothetical protein
MKNNNTFFFFPLFLFLSVEPSIRDTPKVCKQCHHLRRKPSEEIQMSKLSDESSSSNEQYKKNPLLDIEKTGLSYFVQL